MSPRYGNVDGGRKKVEEEKGADSGKRFMVRIFNSFR